MNRCLERSGHEERIDHRSHAERGLDEQPTIHEGVAARAMEKKGIISDRCELNRQIKTDNALLRVLKAQVKKLTELVKGGIAAIAEAMENLRQRMIIFRYQVLHIGVEKVRLSDTLQVVRPELRKYESIAKRLKATIQERRILLEEKKTTPAIQVFRHRELAQKIAALTEDIEELKSEKALLLHQFGHTDAQGMETVKQHVASMEASLEKLNQQGGKYADELDAALAEFDELRRQVEGIDSNELQVARQAIRPEKEQAAAKYIQAAHGKRFNPRILPQSRRDVAELLGEATEPVSIQEKLQRAVGQQKNQHHAKRQDQER